MEETRIFLYCEGKEARDKMLRRLKVVSVIGLDTHCSALTTLSRPLAFFNHGFWMLHIKYDTSEIEASVGIRRGKQYLPDQFSQDVSPAHAGGMVHRSAAVVPAPVGVCTSLQQDFYTFQMPIHNGHIQGGLPLHVHQVDLSPFLDEEVHAIAMASSGSNSQGGARQPTTAPHRLLIDSTEQKGQSNMSA